MILVQWIDATDNGVQIIETKLPGVYPYDIGLYINTFIPSWSEETPDYDSGFAEAFKVAKNLLEHEIVKRKNLLRAKEIVEEVYKNSSDKRVIVFEKYYPTNGVLAKHKEPLFVVAPKEDGTWFVTGIKDDENSFIWRKYFPKTWAGKRDNDLENASGISGAVFCHRGRFIAVNKTKEGAIEMAKKALED